jgi:hypothetical protein
LIAARSEAHRFSRCIFDIQVRTALLISPK